MSRRIERAKELLQRSELSVTEVCMAVGCSSLGLQRAALALAAAIGKAPF